MLWSLFFILAAIMPAPGVAMAGIDASDMMQIPGETAAECRCQVAEQHCAVVHANGSCLLFRGHIRLSDLYRRAVYE
jgi:hypothetical protein